MSESLRTCPFCGSEAVLETFQCAGEKTPRYRVGCTQCWCETDWDNYEIGDAIEKWNKRAEDDHE